MIAKHIPINSVNKSSFSGLVNYILDTQNKSERIGIVGVANCYSDRPDCVIAEVLNTQQMNKRATSDKTYHLVISFRDDELSEDIMKKVEDELCDGLGFGEHQRLSVVHNDTDHLHIHIAINKIHPSRLTIHNPHYDYKVIGELCEKLEKECGLTPDNHETKIPGAQSKESNIEFKAGSVSLVGWIKQECLEQIKSASSWTELNQVLTEHGLELKERGNGFVFVSSNGIGVKASSVDRSLSKSNLVKKLGVLEKTNTDTKKEYKKEYKQKPLRSKKQDTTKLYAQYKKEQNEAAIQGSDNWIKLRDKKNKAIVSAKEKSRFKRFVIKNLTAGYLSKKIMYASVYQELKGRTESIKKEYNDANELSKLKHKRMDWLSWLVKESHQGNDEALEILRSRKDYKTQENSVSGTHINKDKDTVKNRGVIETITRTGTIIVNKGTTAIRDSGDKLFILSGTVKEKIVDVLKEAIKRYGNKLTINGTNFFREKVVQVVVDANLDVSFSDQELEQRRLDLLNKQAGQKVNTGAVDSLVNKDRPKQQSVSKRDTNSTRKGRSR